MKKRTKIEHYVAVAFFLLFLIVSPWFGIAFHHANFIELSGFWHGVAAGLTFIIIGTMIACVIKNIVVILKGKDCEKWF